MKTPKISKINKGTDFSKYSSVELAEVFVFPSGKLTTDEEKEDDASFWMDRRRQFEGRSSGEKIFDQLLQLKFQLEEYVNGAKYNELTNFGYYLNEYVNRQGKKDKQFASEVDITSTVLSQYVNNHRKPTEKFIIRLELHSSGMIPALLWFKLLQKEKEYEIITDRSIRIEESKHVKNRLQFAS